MALVNPYCTVAQLQEELRNTDSALITALEDAINQASRFIDEWKGFDFLLHDYSSTPLTVDAYEGRILGDTLYLPYRPVITLTSVTVAGNLWVKDTDYIVKPGHLVSFRGDAGELGQAVKPIWGLGLPPNHKVSIVGTFGYPQASTEDVPTGLPSTINRAAILIAAAFSGHNQKEIVGLDGRATSITDKTIAKVAMTILGARTAVLV